MFSQTIFNTQTILKDPELSKWLSNVYLCKKTVNSRCFLLTMKLWSCHVLYESRRFLLKFSELVWISVAFWSRSSLFLTLSFNGFQVLEICDVKSVCRNLISAVRRDGSARKPGNVWIKQQYYIPESSFCKIEFALSEQWL